MKLRFLIFFVLSTLFIVSCVSKKKYNEVSKQVDEKTSEKAVLEEVLNKLAVENDSLTKMIGLVDSLYRAEKERTNNASISKREEKAYNKLKAKKSQLSNRDEYYTKAVFVYNFLSYIHWPNDLKSESFNIGIVGNSPIVEHLKGCVYSKSINNAPIKVETFTPGKVYHVLFFSEFGQSTFNSVKKQMPAGLVLYITENSLLENIGAHITLFVDGAKVKYTTNKKVLDKTQLKISPSFYTLSSD